MTDDDLALGARALRASGRGRATLSPCIAPPIASGGNEDVVARGVGRQARDEAEAARVHREQAVALGVAGTRRRRRAELEALPRPRRQDAFEAQVVEQPLESQVVDFGYVEARRDLAHMHRPWVGAEQVEHVVAGRAAGRHPGRGVARIGWRRLPRPYSPEISGFAAPRAHAPDRW